MQREKWSSRIGFIIAGIASAVGLGTIVRFSYLVGKNGGVFLIPYSIGIAFFGIPLMILEFSMGKHFRNSVVPAFSNIGERFKWAGLFIVFISGMILSYYLVITGWILAYFVQFLMNRPTSFSEFTDSYYPLLFFFITGGIAFFVIRTGVRHGIEKVSRLLVPLLFTILLLLLAYTLTMPGTKEGIKFYLVPDLSKLSKPLLWIEAFGQAFYSLGVGLGIMLTYGSYMQTETSEKSASTFSEVEKNAALIALFDTIAAVMGGFVIFPIVFSFGLNPGSGLQLAFITLPLIFQKIGFGSLLGTVFFLLLFIGATSAAISLLEVPVATLIDYWGFERKKATSLVSASIMLIGLPSALSYTHFKLELFGNYVLDLYDLVFGTEGIIVAGLILSVIAGWYMSSDILIKEIWGSKSKQGLFSFIIKFFIPFILSVLLVARFI